MHKGRAGLPAVVGAALLLAASCTSEVDVEPPGPRVSLDDFVFPNEHERLLAPSLESYREPKERWSEEEAERFWVSPQELGLGWIEKKADEEIEKLLETIQ